MEYSILQLADLAGISTRTLRYYDQIGLLSPKRHPDSAYRIYREHEVDVLQQILFYKELGFELAAIKQIIHNPDFDGKRALQSHLKVLEEKQQNIRLLIETVKKTIQKDEGNLTMTDQEKFQGLKASLVEQNEAQFGKEIHEKYGHEMVAESDRKFMNLSEKDYQDMQELAEKINLALATAVQNSENPQGPAGKEIAALHKRWLSYTWPAYTANAHRGLADMYVADPRFTEYYDKNVSGCAQFLRDAVNCHIVVR